MTTLTMYQVDAFASKLFTGNPAAVCPLKEWLTTETMQAIALENNLSETVFFTGNNGKYHIRWFTPAAEVKLCGHATLASAYIIFTFLEPNINSIEFDSLSGPLHVTRKHEMIELDFPALPPTIIEKPDPTLLEAISIDPEVVLADMDYLVILKNQQQIENLQVDTGKLLKTDRRGVIFSAPSDEYDFVSRFFVPGLSVPEDPVTGSAHCVLTPYWAKRLNKNKLHAKQLSARGGELLCELVNDRVKLTGNAILFMKADICI